MDANKLSESEWGGSFASQSAEGPHLPTAPGSSRRRPLDALPRAVLLSFRIHLKPASLLRGKMFGEADEPFTYVYFVET